MLTITMNVTPAESAGGGTGEGAAPPRAASMVTTTTPDFKPLTWAMHDYGVIK